MEIFKCALISADACGGFAYRWVGVCAKRTQGGAKFDAKFGEVVADEVVA